MTRGADMMQESLFTTVHLETFVPKGHPLRVIRALMDEALRAARQSAGILRKIAVGR